MGDMILLFVVLMGGFVLYFLPALIASRRKHNNGNSIFILNLFFGWTFIGWVISLAMALSSNVKAANA